VRPCWLPLLLVGCATSEPEGAGRDSDVAEVELAPASRVALRRMNRHELDRTLRDLLGTEQRPGADFPVDDSSHGFDKVAEALTVSPLLIELMEQVANDLAAEIVDKPLDEPIDRAFDAADDEVVACDAQYQGVRGTALVVASGGTVSTAVDIPEPGTYRVSARMWGDQAGPDPVRVRLGVEVEGDTLVDVDGANAGEADWYEVEVELPRGRHVLQAEYVNDYVDQGTGADRNLVIDTLRVQGPTPFVRRVNPAHDRVVSCDVQTVADPRACVDDILAAFVPKAWRRPVSTEERARLMGLYDQVVDDGHPPVWGLEFALRAVFASPDFLFLVEPLPPEDGVQPLDDHALATRLSYLIWSSMPDQTLFDLADAGELNDPEVLTAQVRRMLDDPKARALSEDLAGQWLMIRGVDDASPDAWTYFAFTEDLRASMKTSMETFFHEEIVRGRRPLTDLLDSPYAWLDPSLALAYGAKPGDLEDGSFARFDVGIQGRRGWLTTMGLLMATSYPTRTSPVRRGVWVLDHLLCSEPPAAPAGVEGFPEPTPDAATVRERLEAHRADPNCAACHRIMDPIGLAFEHFDGIGLYRELDAGQPIDATGELPDGTFVDGVVDLADVLVQDPRFGRGAAEKLFTYGLGRGPTEADAPWSDHLHEAYVASGGTLEDLLVAIVTSEPFRTHGGGQ